jgi:hypothetical protein
LLVKAGCEIQVKRGKEKLIIKQAATKHKNTRATNLTRVYFLKSDF